MATKLPFTIPAYSKVKKENIIRLTDGMGFTNKGFIINLNSKGVWSIIKPQKEKEIYHVARLDKLNPNSLLEIIIYENPSIPKAPAGSSYIDVYSELCYQIGKHDSGVSSLQSVYFEKPNINYMKNMQENIYHPQGRGIISRDYIRMLGIYNNRQYWISVYSYGFGNSGTFFISRNLDSKAPDYHYYLFECRNEKIVKPFWVSAEKLDKYIKNSSDFSKILKNNELKGAYGLVSPKIHAWFYKTEFVTKMLPKAKFPKLPTGGKIFRSLKMPKFVIKKSEIENKVKKWMNNDIETINAYNKKPSSYNFYKDKLKDIESRYFVGHYMELIEEKKAVFKRKVADRITLEKNIKMMEIIPLSVLSSKVSKKQFDSAANHAKFILQLREKSMYYMYKNAIDESPDSRYGDEIDLDSYLDEQDEYGFSHMATSTQIQYCILIKEIFGVSIDSSKNEK